MSNSGTRFDAKCITSVVSHSPGTIAAPAQNLTGRPNVYFLACVRRLPVLMKKLAWHDIGKLPRRETRQANQETIAPARKSAMSLWMDFTFVAAHHGYCGRAGVRGAHTSKRQEDRTHSDRQQEGRFSQPVKPRVRYTPEHSYRRTACD